MEAQTTPRSYWSFPQPVCLWRRYLLAKRQHSSICLIRLLLRPRMLLAILIHIRIVRWFNPVFGDSLAFAGLVAGIEMIGAFRLFAGQLFVRISGVIVGHRVLHLTRGNSGADAKFLF